MGFPAASYISDNARTEGEVKAALEDTLKACKQIPGAGIAAQALTISAGSVTPALGSSQILVIDTEAAAATDELTNIVTTNLGANSLVRVTIANNARVVALKHAAGGSGELSLKTGGDMVLGDTTHWIEFYVNGTQLDEVARFPPAGPAVLSKAANYTVTPADRGKLVDCTATLTLSLPAAATAGKGFELLVECSGGVTTIDPNGAELIGGSATLVLYRGDKVGIVCTGTAWKIPQKTSAQVALDSYIKGFTYAPNGTDPSNDLDIAAGVAMDDAGVILLRGAALTKQLDVAWAAGMNAGLLDTGVVGNNVYYLYVIGRSDTGVVDYLASLSATSPTMPANFDAERRIGLVQRVGGATRAFSVLERTGGGLQLTMRAATTSGTEVDFAVPSGVTEVQLLPNEASLSGADDFLVQLGDAGGIETTGYVSTSIGGGGGGMGDVTSTSGFIVYIGVAGRTLSGVVTLALHDPATFTWNASHVGKVSVAAGVFGGGVKSLSQELSTVRWTRTGANTLDAGSVACRYEVPR